MTNENIIITAEQIEKLLNMHAKIEKRYDKACEDNCYDRKVVLGARLGDIEQVLDVIGIEW